MKNPNSINMPNEIESEAYLLARMLLSVNAANEAIQSLQSEEFSDPLHRAIFNSMRVLYAQDCEIEVEAVSIMLKKEFPNQADIPYLFGLKSSIYLDHEDVKSFIKNIKEASKLKNLIYLGGQLMQDAAAKSKTATDLSLDYMNKIELVFSEEVEHKPLTLSEIIRSEYADSGKDFMAYIEEQMENHRKGIKVLRGIPTGFPRLDDILSGFSKGHYIIVGARPGAGKTTLIINFIYNLVKKNIPVGFFSLEMTSQEVMKKLVGIECEISMSKTERGQISSEELKKVYSASKNLDSIPLVIDDQESLKVSTLISRAKRMIYVNNIQVLFIDYLGEIKGDGKFNTKQDEIQYVSKALRSMAKKLKIPVICIAQLNRDNEKENRPPRKSDLRDSGQIEADAHSILMLHKPSTDDAYSEPGRVKVYVVKNRFGKEGNVYLHLVGETGKFREEDSFSVKEEYP